MKFTTPASLLWGLLVSTATTYAASTSNETASSSTRHIQLPDNFTPPRVFKNVNLLRNINLEKSYIRETINVVIENIDKKPQSEYYIPFSTEIISKVGGLEVREKDAPKKGRFEVERADNVLSPVQYFIARLPEPLAPSSQLTLGISYYILGALDPLPVTIDQDDRQYLTHSFSAYVPSAYVTDNQKTKLKLPNTDIPDFTKTTGLKSDSSPDPEKQGSSLVYGPYKTSSIAPGTIELINIRYELTKPVLICSLLERDIEVSHWGGNLATEDRYWLRNGGAQLKNHFSRVSWAMKSYQNLPTSALRELKVPLKPGSVDPYFTDEIGNVSTSRFRPGPKATLELKPRYPVFGGWKYSFTIGWNNALSSFLRVDGVDTYLLKVPFLEGPKMTEGIQYEKVDLRVVLPEGARNVKYELVDDGRSGMPYEVSSEISLHKTFMDTLGRTVLKLSMENVADEARDGELIVSYEYSSLETLRKPLTFAAGLLSVFIAAWFIGSLDVSIKSR
ncbi:hypothetical protein AJ80_08113 [Polytolypa hystricis UAMH7299]|uniref:Dolichyl-diphosphooligosaccharide--protein glycosyltransferase subunit 1 n=1 Tax=Polytolypa hystricis (strain UAMH7299) TaxID=1447883 RepID=A0A2B7XD55_POLH7|nr:hypothetical protein AJ80_08113 [Polytolypa hystricis UAMH7299]